LETLAINLRLYVSPQLTIVIAGEDLVLIDEEPFSSREGLESENEIVSDDGSDFEFFDNRSESSFSSEEGVPSNNDISQTMYDDSSEESSDASLISSSEYQAIFLGNKKQLLSYRA